MPSARRKPIPWRVKCEVALAKLGLTIREVQFDHTPPLALREWDAAVGDTVPPANDPEHIQILLIAEHRAKTTGRAGESDLSITGNGDLSRIKKAERLAESHEEFRRRLLAREPGEKRPRKGTIRTRPFDKTKTRKLNGSIAPRIP